MPFDERQAIHDEATPFSASTCPNYPKSRPPAAASSRTSSDGASVVCSFMSGACAGRWTRPSAPRLRATAILRAGRRAKYLLLETDAGTLILHLGMSGSLRVLPASTPRIAHDHVDIELDSGLTLRFNDPRRFGSLLFTAADPAAHPLLRLLAPEPLEAEFDGEYLWKITRRRAVAIKQLIMNSRLVVGVGNIYASEALFRARIRPRRQARSLKRQECARLARAIKATLTMAVKVGGTTLRDYVGADGNPGLLPPEALRLRACRQALPCVPQAGQAIHAGTTLHLLVCALPEVNATGRIRA